MNINALVENRIDEHQVILTTNGHAHILAIDPKTTGYGSSVNGAELLCLSLATCYCNDIYREAAKRSIKVVEVEVEVDAEFGEEGEPAKAIKYSAKVEAHASQEEVRRLMMDVDRIAEIHNTIRKGVPVELVEIEAIDLSQKHKNMATIRSNVGV
jgi:uncharacterized OsmC-like protein